MKKLENKVTTIDKGDEEGFIKYSDLIKVVCNQIPQGGLGITEMRERDRILSVVEKNETIFEFEDADAKVLKNLVSEMRWLMNSKDIIMFVEDIEGMV